MGFTTQLMLAVLFIWSTVDSTSYHGRQKLAKDGLPWSGKNWEELSKNRIHLVSKQAPNTKRAKNVILFLGDGMGFSTVAATRAFKAQKNRTHPEVNYLTFETLPYSAISRTYSVDRLTADSASTATAYLCGVKSNYKTIGVREEVEYKKCDKFNDENKVFSAAKHAMKQGKWVGIVTTTRVTDASPAATYAHTPKRGWEAKVEGKGCTGKVMDIASQLILDQDNANIRVILGGGRRKFLEDRDDGKDLIEEWKRLRNGTVHSYVATPQQLAGVDSSKTEYLLGLFADDNLEFAAGDEVKEQPSLQQMAQKALQILSKSPKGFFLFVEGGRIDHAHHANMAHRAIKETLAFDDTVGGALKVIDREETLVVVTADHSHVMTLGGYGSWTEPVLGFAEKKAKDNKKYLQIHYANGPGYKEHRMRGEKEGVRKDIGEEEVTGVEYQQDAGVWLSSESHGGEDVPIYAGGPWAHLFQATEEETYVAHVMMFASCVGQYVREEHCKRREDTSTFL